MESIGFDTWSAADLAEASADGFSEYEALLIAGEPLSDGTKGVHLSGISPRVPGWVSEASAGESMARQCDYAPDEASCQRFSVSHPRWGLFDVDSRQTRHSWDVVVRCGDAETQRRVISREGEFRTLLSGEFGISLRVDTHLASQP